MLTINVIITQTSVNMENNKCDFLTKSRVTI